VRLSMGRRYVVIYLVNTTMMLPIAYTRVMFRALPGVLDNWQPPWAVGAVGLSYFLTN